LVIIEVIIHDFNISSYRLFVPKFFDLGDEQMAALGNRARATSQRSTRANSSATHSSSSSRRTNNRKINQNSSRGTNHSDSTGSTEMSTIKEENNIDTITSNLSPAIENNDKKVKTVSP
jgi:hypothetical protein